MGDISPIWIEVMKAVIYGGVTIFGLAMSINKRLSGMETSVSAIINENQTIRQNFVQHEQDDKKMFDALKQDQNTLATKLEMKIDANTTERRTDMQMVHSKLDTIKDSVSDVRVEVAKMKYNNPSG